MDNQLVAYWLPFIISVIAIGTPVFKLNTTITKLDTTLQNLIKTTDKDREQNDKTKDKVEDHEVRIVKIESKEMK